MPLLEWQRWLVIHALELLPDGSPRFRHILVIVSRQAGKTTLLTLLCLYWLFIDQVRLVLSTSSNLDVAREAWDAGADLAVSTPDLAAEMPPGRNHGIRRANGQECITTIYKGRWRIAASNRRGGRGLSIDRAVLDELREHSDFEGWSAVVPATIARPNSQVWSISNQGDDRAVVLDSRREAALAGDDPAHFIAEWSAPENSRADDPLAIAAANPTAGRRIPFDVLLGEARAALATGGEQLTKYLTEHLCLRVRTRDPAIDGGKWADLVEKIDLAEHRDRVALGWDISLDGMHATLCAAAVLSDGRVAVDVVASWSGPTATRELRAELPEHVRKVKPRAVGWLPAGPAAAVAAELADRNAKGTRRGAWPPPRVAVEEIKGDIAACCMGLAEQVRTGLIAHPGDPLLDSHVLGAERLNRGDTWVFTRRGAGHVDACYALAAAVHMARTLPPAPPPLAVL